ncbi:MAG: ABC transporter ATP-binding protein, partial [Epsilonproteobacteria bacterium]
MSLQSIQIKNFKSIVDINIKNISSFSVFAGSNGSGKSNFFEALEFIRDVIRNGTQEAIKKHNGYENIHSHKLRNINAKRFYAKLTLILEEDSYSYEMEIKELDKGGSLLEKVIKNGTVSAKRTPGNNLTLNGIKQEIEYSEKETILKLISKEAKELLEFLSAIERYQIDPTKAREADDLFTSETLDTYASNLSTVLNKLSKDKNVIEDIMDAMQMIVPGLEKVSIQKESLNSKSYLVFKETGIKRKFPAGLISDGTIYALAMLAIINSNTKGIVLIEEPERGLNPKAIAELVEFFRDKSEKFNIFI